MSVLLFLLQKEFRQIFRDKTIIAMMLAVPTIQLIIMPLAMNFDVKNINLVVVDNDHSSYSYELTGKLAATAGYFRLVAQKNTYSEALELIDQDKADVVLQIPQGFEKNLQREGKQEIAFFANGINSMKSALGTAYLTVVLGDFNQHLRNISAQTNSSVLPKPAQIEVIYSHWFNPLAEYKYYIVPGILVLLLTMIGGFMSALNIVREKEIGTMEQINVTPIRKWEFILGKLIPFWVVGMVVFTVGLAVSYLLYGIVPLGSLWLLYGFAAVYLVALLGFGLLISTYSDNQLQAMFLALFFVMIFMLMSGLFTSVDSMPTWAMVISKLTPITHFIKVVRMIVLKGSTFADVQAEFWYEVAFAVVLNVWAIRNYKKTS